MAVIFLPADRLELRQQVQTGSTPSTRESTSMAGEMPRDAGSKPSKSVTPKPTVTRGRRLLAQVPNVGMLLLGATVQAFGFAAFLVPYDIAAGGMGGLSLVINHVTGLLIGATYFALNIPMFVLGFYNLGRWHFLGKTLLGVAVFSVLTDLFLAWLPGVMEQYPLTDNVLLSAVYGGILGGIGGGLLYRSGAGGSGTSILGRVIQVRTGIPLSQVFLMTDGVIVILMGIVFTWETSLYALLILFLWGMTSDYVLEGPSSVRTVTIVTTDPDPVIAGLRMQMGRTVSHWEVIGGYSGERKYMLMCTVHRPQVNSLKSIVLAADPHAFLVIGDAHQAVGGGFTARHMTGD